MKPVVVGITGASGAAYAVRLVKALCELERDVSLVLSDPARLVIKEELGITLRNLSHPDALGDLLGPGFGKRITIYSVKDFTSPIASGSYPVHSMVIIPCSMGTLGAVANGMSQNLIHRAADCMLKENRRLVMVPRETPLNAVHLENMLKLCRLGVRMVPAMPAFYSGARTVEELVDFVVGKVLDQLEIDHALYPRWTGSLEGTHKE